MNDNDNKKYTTKEYIKLTMIISVFCILIPYLLQLDDLLWYQSNGYNLMEIGNKNDVINSSYMKQIIYEDVMTYNISKKYKKDIALRNTLGLRQKYNVILLDKYYVTVHKKKFERLLEQNVLRYIVYKPEVRDCDEFAFFTFNDFRRSETRYYDFPLTIGIYMGNTLGNVGHAVNIFVETKTHKLFCFDVHSKEVFYCREKFSQLYNLIV